MNSVDPAKLIIPHSYEIKGARKLFKWLLMSFSKLKNCSEGVFSITVIVIEGNGIGWGCLCFTSH